MPTVSSLLFFFAVRPLLSQLAMDRQLQARPARGTAGGFPPLPNGRAGGNSLPRLNTFGAARATRPVLLAPGGIPAFSVAGSSGMPGDAPAHLFSVMPTSQDPDGVGATAANAIGGSPRAPDINAHDNRGVAGAVGSATAAAVAGVTPAVDVMRMGSVPTTFLGTTVSALPHPVHMQPFGPGPALGVPSRQTPEQALAIARGVPSGVPAGGNELPVASSPGGVPSTQLPATPASAPGDGLPRLQLGTQVPSSVAQPPGGGVATPGAAALTGTSTRGGAPPAAWGTGQAAAITPRRATAPRPSAAELQRASPSSNSLMPNPLPAQLPRSRKRAASSPPARPSGRSATAVVPSSPTLLATELATSPPGLQ